MKKVYEKIIDDVIGEMTLNHTCLWYKFSDFRRIAFRKAIKETRKQTLKDVLDLIWMIQSNNKIHDLDKLNIIKKEIKKLGEGEA